MVVSGRQLNTIGEMSNTKRFALGGIELPADIDALEALPSSGGLLTFDFTYRGIRFTGDCKDQGDGTARLKLAGDIGPVPFSAEAPAARVGMAHITMHANNLLGQRFRLAGGRLLFSGMADCPAPVNATALVAAAAGILIPAAPYFELLSVYMDPGVGIRAEWLRSPRANPPQKPLALSAPER